MQVHALSAWVSLWMCSCSELLDIKPFLREGRGLEEDIACTHRNGKGTEKQKVFNMILD